MMHQFFAGKLCLICNDILGNITQNGTGINLSLIPSPILLIVYILLQFLTNGRPKKFCKPLSVLLTFYYSVLNLTSRKSINNLQYETPDGANRNLRGFNIYVDFFFH